MSCFVWTYVQAASITSKIALNDSGGGLNEDYFLWYYNGPNLTKVYLRESASTWTTTTTYLPAYVYLNKTKTCGPDERLLFAQGNNSKIGIQIDTFCVWLVALLSKVITFKVGSQFFHICDVTSNPNNFMSIKVLSIRYSTLCCIPTKIKKRVDNSFISPSISKYVLQKHHLTECFYKSDPL